MISKEQIENFLQGSNPQKYIVAVESYYDRPNTTLIINDPVKGKRVEQHSCKSFLWIKEDINKIIYNGNYSTQTIARTKWSITQTKLRTCNDKGYSPKRLLKGYTYLVESTQSYNSLIMYFKNGGVDPFNKEYSNYFFTFSPTEQFLIQSSKRLFKGIDDYDQVHRFQFDLETEGLTPSTDAIFQIGIRDNKGFEQVIETLGDDAIEKRESERQNIKNFFDIINTLKPDIITGYNSENFDWKFLYERAERLGLDITKLAITLDPERKSKIKRKPAMLKLGAEVEMYEQTHMFGYNILDISHAVRRAMAINSDIKSWGLKYITQYSEIAKPNRIYVPGDKINFTWSDKINDYALNNNNGDWYKINENNPLKNGYTIVKGDYIVQRYLCDDLWETEQIDNIFNQASFLIAKLLPTNLQRSSTMGTATQWKLILAAWSYQNRLGIPETEEKRDFTGGLSKLLMVGYAKNVVKLDFAALYPKLQLEYDIFGELDITGVMEGLLTYIVDTRDEFKFKAGKEKKIIKSLELQLKQDTHSDHELTQLKTEIKKHKALANLYDKKQLPLKILANSWFGSYGAPYIFNWGDTDLAEETTCRGRQSLRLMVKHFTEKYNFKPLVGDTDGFNFSFPDNIDEVKYIAKGNHWKTTENANIELVGLEAVLAEFNENYMQGRMGLDIDDICESTINFARKNYANKIGGKVKLVGNSIKSKRMPVYIEDFLNISIKMLLDGDGYSFINYYHEYVDKIYNNQIPLVKIASKAKVKQTLTEYKKKTKLKNKAGNPIPKQAHMELAIKENIDLTLGDVIYYINTGNSKSHGDLKTIDHNAMTKKQSEEYFNQNGHYPIPDKEVQLNCKLISPQVVEHDFELIKEMEMLKKSLNKLVINEKEHNDINDKIEQINSQLMTQDYNVPKYLDAFNKKVTPLLVCFSPEIRNNILLDIIKIKDKQTKKTFEQLKQKTIFTPDQCELDSGHPFKESDQDLYEDLMKMEDKEIKFWNKVNKIPNHMDEQTWNEVRKDYLQRNQIINTEIINDENSNNEQWESYIKNNPNDIISIYEQEEQQRINPYWNF